MGVGFKLVNNFYDSVMFKGSFDECRTKQEEYGMSGALFTTIVPFSRIPCDCSHLTIKPLGKKWECLECGSELIRKPTNEHFEVIIKT